MNALEFNNQIANLITRFITNIPTFKNGGHPNIS